MNTKNLIVGKDVFVYTKYSSWANYGQIERVNEKWIYLNGYGRTNSKWILIENISKVSYADRPGLIISAMYDH
jgi:ferredoxin-fold anticodon binding domain-containing protein